MQKLIYILLLSTLLFANTQDNSLALSVKETTWLKANPTIKVANEMDWPPFDYNEFGKPRGLSIDYIKLIANKLDLNIEFIHGFTWPQLLQMFKEEQIDVLPALYKNEKRKEFTNFTTPYHKGKLGVFTRAEDNTISSVKDLINLKIGVQESDGSIPIIKALLPNITLIELKNNSKLTQALATKKLDAIIGNPLLFLHYAKENQITNIELVEYLDPDRKQQNDISLHVGIIKDKKYLHSAIQKAIESISFEERKAIEDKWTSGKNKQYSQLDLTQKEKDWLTAHPIIKVANDKEWPPFDFYENGKAKGFSMDYLRALASLAGLKLEFIQDNSWDDLVGQFKEKKLDIMTALEENKERKEFALFTQSYLTMFESIVIKKDAPFLKDYKDLFGKKVAIIRGYEEEKVISESYPQIKMVLVDDAVEGLKKLSYGEVDALLENSSVVSYLLKKYNFTDLKLAGDPTFPSMEKADYIKIAIRKDWPELHTILKKAMEQLPEDVFFKLASKWVNSEKEEEQIKKVPLTKKEKEWIQNNTVLVGGELDWKPFDFVGNNGKYQGISKDILDLVAQKTGLKLEYKVGQTWKELLEDFKIGKLDILPAMYKSEEREAFTAYTKPYFKVKDYVFMRTDDKAIESLDELEFKKVAVIDGYATLESLKKKYPKMQFHKVKSLQEGVDAVILNKADVYIDAYAVVKFYLASTMQTGIKAVLPIIYNQNALHIGINKEQIILTQIVNKALDDITQAQINAILNKWFEEDNNKINLSKEEEAWLEKNQVIKYVYDPNREPFEYTNGLGVHSGTTAEIMNLISKKSSLKFEAITTKSWKKSTQLMKDKKADIFSFVIENEKRKEYLDFSNRTLFKVPVVFITHIDDKNIYENVKFDLEEKSIGIVAGRAMHKKLLKKYPNFNFVELSSVREGFEKVTNGKIDMFAVNKSTGKYYIQIKDFDKTKIATSIDTFFEFKMAVQNTLPKELLSIINKSLDSISEQELNHIYNKTVNIKVQSKTDWVLVGQIGIVVLMIFLFILWNNRKLNLMVKDKTKEISSLLEDFDKNIIASKTDLRGKITYVSDAFVDICEHSREDLVGKPHNIVKHPDMPKEAFEDLWKTIKSGKVWRGEVKNLKKNGGFYWVDAIISPDFDKDGIAIGYSAIRHDITAQKEVEDLTANLEVKIEERTKEIEKERKFNKTLLDSQEQLIITTDGETLLTANETFFDFYAVDTVEEFIQTYDAKCVCDTFNTNAPEGYLQITMGRETWIDYAISRSFDNNHKVMISMGSVDFIFSVTAAKLPGNEGLKSAVFTNITEMENAKLEIEEINKHTRDSIEYASLIQSALIPDNTLFRNYFQDYFTVWQPKDTVGGDVYLFEELREEECLLMVIDCTGHGVPGAFVTMLVKAIERQITAQINNSDEVVSPAKILSIFNRNMKQLLKQETSDSISNAGFDGGIIYYNKKDKIIKFAGAETPLFYVENDELKIIKGNRYSVGYKKCTMDYEYKEHSIDVKEGMQFYLTTDGYLDQNGGEKGFPFGKKKFSNILKEHYTEIMSKQEDIFLNKLAQYQGDWDRNDDVTFVAFKI
ncbi:MAG: transporter substrate-binding domain-containing protein [Helicobacteraceae bacterium]|nr:transporter substrate-binding domain-containing protein [Helicobacteraceae bacterium]